MQARNPDTDRGYDSRAELVAHEANGHTVIAILQHISARSGSVRAYARVTGPFADRAEAERAARRLRRNWRADLADDPSTRLISVRVEPLWRQL